MNDYDLSIILTTYNSEKMIKQAFDALMNQNTQYNYEIIIVDDGSIDNTISIASSYSKRYTNVSLIEQKHGGLSESRNKGIRNAKGTYISFSDDDDQYLPNYVQDMLNKMKSNKLVVGGIKKVFQNGKTFYENTSVLEKCSNNEKLIRDYLTKNEEMDVGAWNKAFDRETIIDNHVLFTGKTYFEDSLFMLKYLECIDYDEIGYVTHSVYELKKRNGSITNSYEPHLLTKCDQYVAEVKGILLRNNVKLNYFKSFEARINIFYVHRNIVNNGEWTFKKQKEFLKKRTTLKSFKYLTLKYKIALALATKFPKSYIDLYSKRNEE